MKVRIRNYVIIVFLTTYFTHHSFGQTPVWPLQSRPVIFYNIGAVQTTLLAKVKYTGRNNKAALFNMVYNYNCNTISAEGVATNEYFGPSFASYRISIIRSVGTMGSYLSVSTPGSATSYGRDFESDSLDNFFILADNNGNTWDTAFHSPPLFNKTDSTQLLLYKIDTLNKVSWFKFYGGTSAEYAKCLKRTIDGNLLVLASTQSNNGDVTNHQGGKDIWLLKINASSGNIIWQKTYGSTADEVPSDMELLADGTIMIAGTAPNSSFFPDAKLQDNAFLMKLDANGNVSWKKTFGGNGFDLFRNLIAINDGGFACIGTTNSGDGDLPEGLGGTDVFITKHRSDGTLQWIKQYGNADNDIAGDIVYTSCDSSIFASYAKQYSLFPYPMPAFTQVTGVEIGLRNNGTQFHFAQNNFNYPLTDDVQFNEGFSMSMAPNDRGGFLNSYIYHHKWPIGTPPGGCQYTRSFNIYEYGEKPATRNVIDTNVCKGAIVFGQTIIRDTTLITSMQNACGIDTLIKQYNLHVSDLFLDAPAEVLFTPGVPIVLTPLTNGTITWQPAPTLSCTVCQTATATPTVPVKYYLIAQKNGCTIYDTISMVRGNDYYIYIPTAFTPNDDGLNDRFNAIASGLIDYELKIFNRWGQHIYTTNSLVGGWDGKIDGRKQGTNTFVYLIQIGTITGERKLYKGTFTLIR